MEDHQQYLDFAKDLAREAGQIMRRYFNADDANIIAKEDDTPLTIADTAINQLVIDRVKEKYPMHGVLGEEDSFNTDAEYLWVCDPIDGTIAYSHGSPASCFSLALIHNKTNTVAVLYDPIVDRLASASAEKGAWLNDEPLAIDKEYPHIGAKCVVLDIWQGFASCVFDEPELPGNVINSFHKDYVNFSFASTTYAGLLVGIGQISGLVIPACSAWDFAAMDLIIREAGGVVADSFGDRTPQDYTQVYTRGMIAARSEAEYREIIARIKPLFDAAKRKKR